MQSPFQSKVSPSPPLYCLLWKAPIGNWICQGDHYFNSILLQPYVRRYRIFFFKILPMRNERKLGMARWRVTDVFKNSILLVRLSKFVVRKVFSSVSQLGSFTAFESRSDVLKKGWANTRFRFYEFFFDNSWTNHQKHHQSWSIP